MKKRIAIITAALLLLALSACGGKSVGLVPANSENSSEGTVLTEKYDRNDTNSICTALDSEIQSAADSISEESALVAEDIGEDYQKYSQNKKAIGDFYRHSYDTAQELYSFMKVARADYFMCIAEQGLDDYDTWNDAMEDFYNTWDDGMEDFYHAWDDSYSDLYSQCDDAIEIASDSMQFSEYTEVWTGMYEEYIGSWSNMYKAYSGAWSDAYRDYSSIWSGFYSGNTDVAALLKEAEESGASSAVEEQSPAESESQPQSTEDSVSSQNGADNDTEPETKENLELVDGMRPEFKEAIDSYEAFYDGYCDLMKKFNENPNDIQLLNDYTALVAQLDEVTKNFEVWEGSDLNSAEMKYYIEVNSRVEQKLIDIASY